MTGAADAAIPVPESMPAAPAFLSCRYILIQAWRYCAPMLPLVPFTVFTFIPTGNPAPVATSAAKSGPMVMMASASLSSISRIASSGLSQTFTSLKYPEEMHSSIRREDSRLLLPSTTARFMLRISILTANGKTSIISTGNIRAILGSPGSLKNCLNSFSKRYFHISVLF